MGLDPSRTEIDFEGAEYSWGDLARMVDALERALAQMNIPADARVGVLLRNRPGHVAAIAAVLASDRCLVAVSPLLPDSRLFEEIERLGLAVMIFDEEDAARPGMADCLARSESAGIVIAARLEHVRLFEEREQPSGSISTAPDVAIEMLTSGTTGTPKRVPLTRAAFDASFAGFTAYQRGRDYAEPPRLRSGATMVVSPLTHIGGIYGCINALLDGRKIVLLEKFTVGSWVEAIKRNRLKLAPAVPSAVRALLEADIDPADLSSLSAIISGTAPLPPDLVEAFDKRFGVPILGTYGATEMAGAVAGWSIDDFRAHWRDKRGSVGRVQPNVRARIVDPDNGAVLAPGMEGLLELQGSQLGERFAVGTAEWMRTTDRAVLDADGFLFIRGRADNAIIRGGFKVHPDDIVEVLNQHPAVFEAAVVGVADARLGAVPAAAVILKAGSVAPDADALKAWLRERLIAYQVPVHIRFVEGFPRTPSLKPSLPDLKALFDQPAAASEPATT